MSRIGNKPIPIPSGVTVTVEDRVVTAKGPKGTLQHAVADGISVEKDGTQLVVSRESDLRLHRSLHGLTRTLVFNMITGVSQEFQKSLELVGVGYRAQESANGLTLQLGFSHPVEVPKEDGVTLAVEANTRIHVSGIDKQRVGQMAANIRALRTPNAYTGKGIRYMGEQVRLKPGKTAGRAR